MPYEDIDPVLYSIQKGDTLYGIAQQNSMELDDLIKLNSHIKDPNKIQIGQKISVPGERKPEIPAEPIDVNESAMEYVKGMEGFIPSPIVVEKHKDKAHRTVGYGHYLDSSSESKLSFSTAFPDKTYDYFASGVGQLTEEEAGLLFKEDFKRYVDRAKRLTPELDSYSPELQVQILSATYRGSWGDSPKTRQLLKEGKFDEAALEFINRDEYRNAEDNNLPGLIPRMNSVRDALKAEGGKQKTKTIKPRTLEDEAKSVARFVEDEKSGLTRSLSKIVEKNVYEQPNIYRDHPWAGHLIMGALTVGGTAAVVDNIIQSKKGLSAATKKGLSGVSKQELSIVEEFIQTNKGGGKRALARNKYIHAWLQDSIEGITKVEGKLHDTPEKLSSSLSRQTRVDQLAKRMYHAGDFKDITQKQIENIKRRMPEFGKYAKYVNTYEQGKHLEAWRKYDKTTGGSLFKDNPDFKTKQNWKEQQKLIKEGSPSWKKFRGDLDKLKPAKWGGVAKSLGSKATKVLPIIGFLVSLESMLKSKDEEVYGMPGGFSLDDLKQLKEPLTLVPHILQQIEDMAVSAKPLIEATTGDKTVSQIADFKNLSVESLLHAVTQDIGESIKMSRELPQAVLDTTLDSLFDLVKRLPQVKPVMTNTSSSFLKR